MQTSQGKYSYEVVDAKGKSVIEFDGISDEGWIEEIKINQGESEANIDEIMSNLRRRAQFAQEHGLKGVRYSIDPPSVQFEVESRVAAERLPNTYAVERGGP
jgi:hypothetical protein